MTKKIQNIKIDSGKILLADPFLLDPNFKRAVILLCEHQEEGSIGFIINKPINMNINDLVSDFPDFESEVYYGGPVATDTIHYIHNVGDLLDESVEISRGVYWGGEFDKLKFLISSELIKPQNIRFLHWVLWLEPGPVDGRDRISFLGFCFNARKLPVQIKEGIIVASGNAQ